MGKKQADIFYKFIIILILAVVVITESISIFYFITRYQKDPVPTISINDSQNIPVEENPISYIFYVVSDMRKYSGEGEYDTLDYFRGAVEFIKNQGDGEFLLVVGDLDPVEDVEWTIETYLGNDFLWYPIVGNHELPGGGNEDYYGKNMELLRAFDYKNVTPGPEPCPETTFTFDYENSQFIVLNEYCDIEGDTATSGDIPDLLYNWLSNKLEEADSAFTFVIGHEPAYPQPDAGTQRERHYGDSLDQYPENRDRFWNLLSDNEVDAYFCGHTHNYSIYSYQDVWQVDSGHARGIGDTGADSTVVKVIVREQTVMIEAYRKPESLNEYKLVEQQEL